MSGAPPPDSPCVVIDGCDDDRQSRASPANSPRYKLADSASAICCVNSRPSLQPQQTPTSHRLKRKAALKPSIIDPPTSPESQASLSCEEFDGTSRDTVAVIKCQDSIRTDTNKKQKTTGNLNSPIGIAAYFSSTPTSKSTPKGLSESAPNPWDTSKTLPLLGSPADSPMPSAPTFSSPHVQIQKGKVIFRERTLLMDKNPATVGEICRFHDHRRNGFGDGDVLKFPESFLPLLAKLIQDSDLQLASLIQNVKLQLFPDSIDSDHEDEDYDSDRRPCLSDAVISHAISSIAQRKNYGLNVDGIQPASCSIWRWEVTDKSLLGEFREKVEARVALREHVCRDVAAIYASLQSEDQQACLGKHGVKRKSFGLPSLNDTPAAKREKKELEKLAAKKVKDELREKKEQEKRAAKEAKDEAKRKKDEERFAAERAKEELRLKKEEERIRSEKDKEEQRLKKEKSQPSVASFVFKIKKECPIQSGNSEDTLLAAFKERFPGFHSKPNVIVATHNIFWRKVGVESCSKYADESTIRQDYRSFLNTQAGKFRTESSQRRKERNLAKEQRKRLRKQALLGSPTDLCVNDCAIYENENDPAFERFRGRKWRLLQFAEDFRPPYFGTWTKHSERVGSRRPWAMDSSLVDYSCDSEAEWEEDEIGEELGSEVGDDEDLLVSGVANGDADDDMNDWLVPDGYLSEDEVNDDEEGKTASNDKPLRDMAKKKIAPLVPIVVSAFESDLTEDVYLDTFKIHWMTEANTIDPFNYKSQRQNIDELVNHPKPVAIVGSLMKDLKTNSEKHSFEDKNVEPLIQYQKAQWVIKEEFARIRGGLDLTDKENETVL
ncbi:hypothetical protein HDU83_000666 [Entophlyctis luteolus]|nr:hypothetical protein HDU83_000666 [Entophlyctis luteolus]